MKTFLGTAMIIALGITGFFLWGAVHVQRVDVSSSQIFIHGTPVCVMQQGRDIIASVGLCGTTPGGGSLEDSPGSGGRFHEGTPSPRKPRLDLPPGHPPIDSPPEQEGRRILI